MGYEQSTFPDPLSPQGPGIGRTPIHLRLRSTEPDQPPVSLGYVTLDELEEPGRALIQERLHRPINSHICRTIADLKGWEFAMSRDLSDGTVFSRNAIRHLIWAFGQSEWVDPLECRRFHWSSSFGHVVEYSAIWTRMFSGIQELDDFYHHPHYLRAPPFEYSAKKVVSPEDIEPGVKLAIIHGRFEGGFFHPGHARAVDNLIGVKEEDKDARVLLAVDSAYTYATGHTSLVSPLFSLSVAALYPGIDYVMEILGPDETHWRTPYQQPVPSMQSRPIPGGDQEIWNKYYEQLYEDWNVRYVHIREADPMFAVRMARAEKLGIEPVIHYEPNDRPVYSDSTLRGIARDWEIFLPTGEEYWTDYAEKSKEMALQIAFDEIPRLEERLRRSERNLPWRRAF